jgi:hypothetical protein
MAYKMEITLDHDGIRFAAQEWVKKEFPDKQIDKIEPLPDGTIKYTLKDIGPYMSR